MIEAAQRAGDQFGASALRRNFESHYRRDSKYLFAHAKLTAAPRK